jgi:TatD DNase family protein
MLVDSHCHLHLINYELLGTDLAGILATAAQNQVERLLCVGTTLKESPEILRIADQYAQVFASVGQHPNEVEQETFTLQTLLHYANHPKVIAIGETGLDYYRDSGTPKLQQTRFAEHIQVARALKKPLIIHTRHAREDTLSLLKREQADSVGGVFHCFTEDWDTAKAALSLNFYISFSGIVTFKNATALQTVAKEVPIDRLLLETDAPYLAPVPYRGQINQPAYVTAVAAYIAELRGISLEVLAQQTTQNFYRLFFNTMTG